MGMSATVNICYGFVIYDEDNEANEANIGQYYLELEDEIIDEEGYPKYEPYLPELPYYLKDDTIDIVTYGWESSRCALAVAESVLSFSEYEVTELKALETKDTWNKILQDFCNKSGFTYREPKWLVGVQIS